MPVKIDNILSWCSELETQTLLQAAKTSRLSFVTGHVALMSDAHVGLGSTVGSVIPTTGAIIPAAIGVDIGCVDAETECLTPNGWVRMDQWNGEEIMIFDPDLDCGWFQDAKYLKLEATEDFYWFKTKYGVDQMLSPEHKVLYYKYDRGGKFDKYETDTAENLAKKHSELKLGLRHRFLTNFNLRYGTKADLTDEQIRVMVMVSADAHLANVNTGNCIVALRKLRKIERIRQILYEANIPFVETPYEDRVNFRFNAPMADKSFDWAWKCSPEQLVILVEECFFWDGNQEDMCFFTRSKQVADFMHYAMTCCGYRSVLRVDKHYRDGALDYRVFANSNTKVGIAGTPKTSITRVPSKDGFKYCFTTSTGFWIMRRGGNIVVTGNCGMIGVLTDLNAAQLPDSLEPILNDLEQVIPAGVGKGHLKTSKNADLWFAANHDRFSDLLTPKLTTKLLQQFGSLGSGNHFFELCLDELARVWLVLHSGSRGIGNQLAGMHIKKARNLMRERFITLEDPDLAYFVEQEPEFDAYIQDMLVCQDYALANREQMMNNALSLLFISLGFGAEQSRINCHHNFTQKEHHHNKNLWITRKGAIKAAVGDLGIIPGSMGTSTFIVEGLGNPASYNSCSHGAGRKFSRSRAKAEFSEQDLIDQMQGVTWQSKKARYLIDEIPTGYKPIETVMQDQQDLVTIKHTLKQVLNYKGTG